jgi:hypothetical protein
MKISNIFKLLRSPFQKRVLTRKANLAPWMEDSGLTEPKRNSLSIPAAASRIKTGINSGHNFDQIEFAINAFEKAVKNVGVLPD